jgi:hypothetical protein
MFRNYSEVPNCDDEPIPEASAVGDGNGRKNPAHQGRHNADRRPETSQVGVAISAVAKSTVNQYQTFDEVMLFRAVP